METTRRTRKSPGLNKLYDDLAQAAINYDVGEKLTIRIPQHLPKRVPLVITVREQGEVDFEQLVRDYLAEHDKPAVEENPFEQIRLRNKIRVALGMKINAPWPEITQVKCEENDGATS